ncbi:MAG: response regulator transcription factor [Oscillospiraceae bacterium]
MKILVVEDEKDLRESLTEALRLDGYGVDCCEDGEKADQLAFEECYDLIILDLNLPKLDGMEVLKNIRRNNCLVNVLILSARGATQDKINGLDFGANDYMTKPFHMAELQARVRSLLRRKTVQENTVLTCGDIALDTISHRVTAKGALVALTGKETAILEYMLLHKGGVISQQELLEHVWDGSVDCFSNSVRVHISSLRRKLGRELGIDPIKNRIGEGYTLEEV